MNGNAPLHLGRGNKCCTSDGARLGRDVQLLPAFQTRPVKRVIHYCPGVLNVNARYSENEEFVKPTHVYVVSRKTQYSLGIYNERRRSPYTNPKSMVRVKVESEQNNNKQLLHLKTCILYHYRKRSLRVRVRTRVQGRLYLTQIELFCLLVCLFAFIVWKRSFKLTLLCNLCVLSTFACDHTISVRSTRTRR